MPTPGKTSRSASKRNKLLPPVPNKSKPGLAVDTSFSRHRGHTPQQVFPYESKTQEPTVESLLEARAPKSKGTSNAKGGLKEQLENKVYVPPPSTKAPQSRPPASGFSLQPVPLHKRVNGLRPSPLELSNEVSPSDRAIEIGIAVPSADLSQHTDSPETSAVPQRQASQKYGQEYLTTPTIIVTPAKEDFDDGLTAPLRNYRPTSSVYSRYTNCVPKRQPRIEGTPPVPPLPLFAEQSAVSSHDTARDSSLTEFEEQRSTPPDSTSSRSNRTSSVHTDIEEDSEEVPLPPVPAQRSVSWKRRSSQAGVPTPRRSKGYWNILSPFSASARSANFSFLPRSPSLREEDEDADDRPILSAASGMGISRDLGSDIGGRSVANSSLRRNFSRRTPSSLPRSGTASSGRGYARPSPSESGRSMYGDQPQSAPPSGSQFSDPARTGGSIGTDLGTDRHRMPQRSDTAPGALDFGNADDVNIYRAPDTGAASAYYDSGRNFSSGIPSSRAGFGASRGPDFDDLPGGWDPRQSVAGSYGKSSGGMRDTEFYGVPQSGAAAPYYDSNRNFPSTIPDGVEDLDRAWSPSHSCHRSQSDVGSTFGEGEMMRSPTEFSHDGRSVFDSGGPLESDHVVQMPTESDYNGYSDDPMTARTAGPMRESTFEGFSGTYPSAQDRGFFSTPSEDELHGGTSAQPLTTRDERLSHMTATPILESAQTATYMGPLSANGEPREVDVASLRTRTPTPPGYPLASSTMASRMPRSDYGEDALPPVSEKSTPAYPYSALHSRNGSEGLGISDTDRERALFPPQHTLSEKPTKGSEKFPESTERSFEEDESPGEPWYRRFLWLLVALAIAALAALGVLLYLFLPRHHHDHIQTQAQWLILAGFPPLPTGVTTVIGPKAVKEVSGCVQSADLWSCSAAADNDGSAQPNFRLQIRFRNGTSLPSNETAVAPSNSTVVKRGLFSNPWYESSPKPPSTDDQIFLGETTDKNVEPYNGEETPFYISLLNASASVDLKQSKLRKRDDDFQYPYPTPTSTNANPTAALGQISSPYSTSSATSTSGAHPTHSSNPNNAYPYPGQQSNGVPLPGHTSNNEHASATLYPLPSSQPLRLFNRGQASEHYSFYTYFDRTLTVSNLTASNSSGTSLGSTGSSICTWSQTRFLVQIWTRKPTVTSLNSSANATTANDMTAPGSFPYSITVTIDRHGGDASGKSVFCYSLDENEHVVEGSGTWIAENRAFGGLIVNPATAPIGHSTADLSKRATDNAGGIDGGTGGCECQWQN